MQSENYVPLFKLETLLELRIDPWDELLERRRDAVAAATPAAGTSSSSAATAPFRRSETIVATAFKKVGDSSILAIVVETNSVLLRHWLSDGSGHKLKELMWFRSGQLRIRCLCFDPSGNWLLAVTADGRLYLIAALFILDSTASSDCSWTTEDLVCLSEDLALEGRPSAICWWETLDNKKIAIVGTDCDELVFVDLATRQVILRLRQTLGASQLIVVDLNIVSNDAQSQTTLLITQRVKLRGSGDFAASPSVRQMVYASATSYSHDRDRVSKQPEQQQQQSCLVLEKRLENKLGSLSPLDLDFTEDYVFQGLYSILDTVDPSLPPPRPTSLPKIPDGSGRYASPQFSKGHHFLSVFDPHHSTVEIWDPEMNQPAPSFFFDLPDGVENIILTDNLLICRVDEGDYDEILFLSRHFTSKTTDASDGNLASSRPSASKSPSSMTRKAMPEWAGDKPGVGNDFRGGGSGSDGRGSGSRVKFDRDWRFPRLLQKIRLPAGERLRSMEKLTFPFYFLDGESHGEDDFIEQDVAEDDEMEKVFGWSRARLQFATPTVLDGCLLMTQNCVFVVSPGISPERIAFELMVDQMPAQTFTTALGLHCSTAFEAAREYRLLQSTTNLPLDDSPINDQFSSMVDGNDERIWKSFLLLIEHGRYEEALSLNSKGAFDEAFAVGEILIPPTWLVKSVPANQVETQSSCRNLYFQTLVAMVRENVLLSSASSSASNSSSSSSSSWTTESILRFTSTIEIDFNLVTSVLIRHDFLQLALEVSRKRNQLQAFLRLFASVETKSDKSKDIAEPPFGVPPAHDYIETVTRSENRFPWRLLLFDAELDPAECWTLVHFLKSAVGLLDQFLLRADDDEVGELFRIMSSSYALFINSLDLIGLIVSRLGVENLEIIIRLSRLSLPLGNPLAYSVTTLLQVAQICLYARGVECPSEYDRDPTPSGGELALPLRKVALSAGYDRGIFIQERSAGDDSTRLFLSKAFSNPSPTFVKLSYPVDSVSCGSNHALALACGGSLMLSWGSDHYGQLGIGKRAEVKVVNAPTPVFVVDLCDAAVWWSSIVCGGYHSLALTRDGNLFAWGWGVYGQLALGDFDDSDTPKKVASNVTGVSAGHAHSAFLSNSGRLYVVGSNHFGQLGISDSDTKKVTTLRELTFKSEDLGDDSNAVYRVLAVSCGLFHTLALVETSFGDVANPIGSDASVRRVLTWGVHPLALRNMMRTGTKGRNHFSPSVVKTPTLVGRVCHLSAGGRHDCLLTEDGYILSWGSNAESQLGTGNNIDAREPAMMIPLNDRKISRLSAGGDFTMAADESGAVYVWGKTSIAQNFATTSTSSPCKSNKPFIRCGEKTAGKKMKETAMEFRTANIKRVNDSCEAAPSIGDYPPLPPGVMPFIRRLSAYDTNAEYDWSKVLSVAHELDSSRLIVIEGMDGRERERPRVLQERENQVQQTNAIPASTTSPSLRPLIASLYWMRGMKTLCLVSLLETESMTEEQASLLIRSHFRACGESSLVVEENEFPATLSWIFNLWSKKRFSTSGLESCLASVTRILPSLRRLILNHLKTTPRAAKAFHFSVGFLSRLFSAVMEEEEAERRRLEGEEEKRSKETRERLWNAIENNLKREVGKRTKAICLSAAQVEALGNISTRRNSLIQDTSDGLYLFTCGHHYKSAELRHFFHSSPTFVSPVADDQNAVLMRLYESMTDFQSKSLACPACLTLCLKSVVADSL